MTIELSKHEVEMLDQALEAWEKSKENETMMASLFSAVLCPKELREQEEVKRKAEMDGAKKATAQRRMQATMVRAKLFQALNRESEHDCVNP